MVDKPSLSFYTNIPTPYQRSFFEELAKLFELTVIYYSITEGNREWKFILKENYKVILLRNNLIAKLLQKAVFDFHFSWRIFSVAWKDTSNHVIVGGSYATANATIALLLSKLKGKKVAYFSEPLFKVHNIFKHTFKWLYLRILNICCDAIFCIGKQAAHSFDNYKINVPKFIIPYNIDVKKFSELDPSKKEEFSKRFKSKDEVILLYSGVLEYRKGVDILIQAIKEIKYENVRFLILGNGPQKKELMLLSGDDNRIIYLGFREPEELPYFFAIADIFTLASRYDGWAVVINEAIAASLPVISSNKVGAAIELITSDKFGLICESENVLEFKNAMELLIMNKDKRNDIKENIKSLIPFISSDYNARLVYDILTCQLQ